MILLFEHHCQTNDVLEAQPRRRAGDNGRSRQGIYQHRPVFLATTDEDVQQMLEDVRRLPTLSTPRLQFKNFVNADPKGSMTAWHSASFPAGFVEQDIRLVWMPKRWHAFRLGYCKAQYLVKFPSGFAKAAGSCQSIVLWRHDGRRVADQRSPTPPRGSDITVQAGILQGYSKSIWRSVE